MTWTQWPTYSPQCQRDVQRLLKRGGSLTAYKANPSHGVGPTPGSWAWKLEREAERVHQVPHVIACANGTIALETLLRELRYQPKDVTVSAFTFSATVAAIMRAGWKPMFVDVTLPGCHGGSLMVDLFGCQAPGVWLVDACQSVGIPPIASYGVWSFNGRKNVPAGEAGAVFINSKDVVYGVRAALGHGENFGRYDVGINGHINEVTACIAYHGMRAVKARNAHRQRMARYLNAVVGQSDRVICPNPVNHAFYIYPLIIDTGMMCVADKLEKKGVMCQRGYIQPPLHKYRAFRHLPRDPLPVTESLSEDRLLLFPQVTPTATRQEMEWLGEQILAALR